MRAAFWDGPKTGMPTGGDETGRIKIFWVALAFAEVGFNAIDEGLFGTGDHQINLMEIRVVQNRGNVASPRFLLRT